MSADHRTSQARRDHLHRHGQLRPDFCSGQRFLSRPRLRKSLMRGFGCPARARTSQLTRIATVNASLLRADEKLTAFLELGAGACAGLA
jgi:hypothetical protein